MATTNTMKKADLNRLRLSVVGGKNRTEKKEKNKCLYNQSVDDREDNMRMMDKASVYWFALQNWRDRIERSWRYLNGNQWGDLIWDPESGGYVKEKTLIEAQGQIPFVVNMIVSIVENIIGQFLSAKSRSSVLARTREDAPVSEMLTNKLWAVQDINRMWRKDASALKMFLCSSAVIQRVDYGMLPQRRKMDVRFKNRELSTMFFNPLLDQDLDDLTFIGQFHDMPLDSIISEFAKSKEDETRIREMFSFVNTGMPVAEAGFTDEQINNKNFYFTSNSDKARVFELWEKRHKWQYEYTDPSKGILDWVDMTPANKAHFDKENRDRIELLESHGLSTDDAALITYKEKYTKYWHFKYVTADYKTLAEGESPYEDKSHPYVLLFHSFIRGETMSFVETLIDIQRGFNRDKILLDFIIGASAKGTLMISEESITDKMSFEEMAHVYSKRNGVILYKAKNGAQLPQQLISKSLPAGLNESLQLGMQLMNQQGGVGDALQGRSPGAGVPAARYAMEAQNSTLNIKYKLDDFNIFRSMRDEKIVDRFIQFKKEKEYLTVGGNNNNEAAREYDPDKIKDDLEREMTIGQGSDSQIYRAMMDEWIDKYVSEGLIPLKIGLKHVSFPGADKLIADLDEFEKQAQQPGAAENGMQTPQMVGGMVGGLQSLGADPTQADPRAMELANKYAGVA